MWRAAVVCLLVLGLVGIHSFEVNPLSPISCPERDELSKTYYVLERYNTTCHNTTFDRCHTSEDTDKDSSSEDDDDYWKHDDHHHHHHHHHEQQQHWITGHCWDIVSANCTRFRCVKKCFDGWAMDELKQCTKYVGSDKQPCFNGGKLDSDEKCICQEGFTGQYCDKRACEKVCQNGGECSASMYGDNYCLCPPPFFGPQCLQVKCPEVCQNGGQCIVNGPRAICLCKPGYYGKTCASQIQNECPPPNNTLCTDLTCRDTCNANYDCRVEQRCCTDGCCNSCVKIEPFVCVHEGAKHFPGQMFVTRDCVSCMCHWNSTVTCNPITCPDVQCPNGELTHTGDQCCPTCNGVTLPPGYTKPAFVDDVNFGEGAIVHVSMEQSTFEMKDLKVQAHDYNNKPIPVHYQPKVVRHCLCSLSYRAPIPMVLFAKDSFGQTTERRLSIFLTDNAPPTFESCPADIYALSSEAVFWQKPLPVDNVGIARLDVDYTYNPLDKTSDPNEVDFGESARKYPIGNFTVTYTAFDFDYNMATCQFSVYVFDETFPSTTCSDHPLYNCNAYNRHYAAFNTNMCTAEPEKQFVLKYCPHYCGKCYTIDYSRFPPELAAREKDKNNTAGIVGGCVTGILTLVIITTLAVAVHKRRQINRQRTRAAAHVTTNQAQQNAVTVSMANPEYQGSSAAPPPYNWASAPPTYDEVKDMAKDDPPKYEELAAQGEKMSEENIYESVGKVECPHDTRVRY